MVVARDREGAERALDVIAELQKEDCNQWPVIERARVAGLSQGFVKREPIYQLPAGWMRL